MCRVILTTYAGCSHPYRYSLIDSCPSGFCPQSSTCHAQLPIVTAIVPDLARPLCEACFRLREEEIRTYFGGMKREVEWVWTRFAVWQGEAEVMARAVLEMEERALEELRRDSEW